MKDTILKLRFILTAIFILGLLSCSREDKLTQHQNENKKIKQAIEDIILFPKIGLWKIKEFDNMSILIFEETSRLLSVEDVIEQLNLAYRKDNYPELVFEKMECQTAYVKILKSDLLTQRMGSSGAKEFLASATFSITSISDIEAVYFDFEPGDHAVPGRYRRIDFYEFWPM